jgi:hypothetical protein
MTSPNNMKVGDYGIINTNSPNNTGRVVQVLDDMGTFDLPIIGSRRIFKVIPVADRPMATTRLRDDGKQSITLIGLYQLQLKMKNWIYFCLYGQMMKGLTEMNNIHPLVLFGWPIACFFIGVAVGTISTKLEMSRDFKIAEENLRKKYEKAK